MSPQNTSLDAHWSGVEDGPVVVLIHGLAGSHRTWTQVVPLLEDRLRVVAVDLPGGRSIEQEAESVAGLLEAGGVRRATVVGHSMGGHVATAVAERAPELVERLVLIDTAPTVESRLTANSGSEGILRLPVVGWVLWSRIKRQQAHAALRSAFGPDFETPEPLVADLVATPHRAFAGSTVAIDRYLGTRPLQQRLADLTLPVDVVFGMKDQRVDPDSLRVYQGIGHVRVTKLADAGHTPPWEAPQELAAVICDAAGPG